MPTVRMTLRLPPEVAAVLDQLPNRSEFVRDAVMARLGTLCPQCQGTGVILEAGHLSERPEE